jgi:chromosome segregation ATPase
LQGLQVQAERTRNKISELEKVNLELLESSRVAGVEKGGISKKLANALEELEGLKAVASQMEQTKEKKEAHYRQELEKYTQRYMESENCRNKIVFELENSLREQLGKKDEYYLEVIGKLESKVQANGHSSKETLTKKEREVYGLIEKLERMEREKAGVESQLHQSEEERQEMANFKAGLEERISQLAAKLKTL